VGAAWLGAAQAGIVGELACAVRRRRWRRRKFRQPAGVRSAPSMGDLAILAMRSKEGEAVIKVGPLAPVGGFNRC
jgi:hypothetical protein